MVSRPANRAFFNYGAMTMAEEKKDLLLAKITRALAVSGPALLLAVGCAQVDDSGSSVADATVSEAEADYAEAAEEASGEAGDYAEAAEEAVEEAAEAVEEASGS